MSLGTLVMVPTLLVCNGNEPWNLSNGTHTFSLQWHAYFVQYFNVNAAGSYTSRTCFNRMRTTSRLVKMNILSFIEPIREGARKNSMQALDATF